MLKWKVSSTQNSFLDTSGSSQHSSSLADSDEILIDSYNANVSHFLASVIFYREISR